MCSQRRATQIETGLIICICMLSVLTYVVFYKVFWNWIGVVRFVSHEILFTYLTCKRVWVCQSEGLSLPRSSVWCRPENSNSHGLRPSIKGTKILLKEIKAIIIIMTKGLLFNTFFMNIWYKLCHCDHSVIGRQNNKFEMKCIIVLSRWRCFTKKCAAGRGQIFYGRKCSAGKTHQTKCATG